MSLEAISIPPLKGKPAERLLVALHGWGASSQDLVTLAPFLRIPGYQLVFPNAPFPHYAAPGGRAWYALEKPDFEGINESRQLLREWLLSLEETTGIPLSRTVVGGFSQGGAMSLDVGLNLPLAGLCSLSGYLHSELPTQLDNPPPVLVVHGTQDTVVPLKSAHRVRDALSKLGVKFEYHELEIAHEIQVIVLELLKRFLQEIEV